MSCASTAHVSSWIARDFTSIEELNTKKSEILQKANASNMPKDGIDAITHYFDEYINAGFVTTINGKAGQTLKIFSDYCIINTKNESKQDELVDMFYQFDDLDDDDDDDAVLSATDKKALAQGLMSGRWVQAGIGAVVSASINQEEKEKAEIKKRHTLHKRREKLVIVGERRIDLKKMDCAEMFTKSNAENGYLRFIPKGVAHSDLYSSQYFFFKNTIPFESKKIRKRVEEARDIINDRIIAIEVEAQVAAEKKAERQATAQAKKIKKIVEEATQENKSDVFEEIRKYKQLLDEGIITQEEFDTKKKQILKL